MFNILTAGHPDALEGTVWYDLFAGTGAVGIEALSRGASKVHFVESSSVAADLIRRNLQSLGVTSRFEVVQEDVLRVLKKAGEKVKSADFVFLDPPYRLEGCYRATLELLSSFTQVKANMTVVAEHFKKFDPGEKFGGLVRYRAVEQGDAVLSFYRPTQRPQETLRP